MIAFLFPGQGSQRPGLLRDSEAVFAASALFDEASEILGVDVRREDDGAALARTEIVQRNIFLAGVAGARALERSGVRAQAVAGHSIGALTAATIAGTLSFEEAVRLADERGRGMARAFGGGYAMAAILGMSEHRVAEIIVRAVTDGDVAPRSSFIAVINARDQIVIAGFAEAVRTCGEIARSRGARDVRLLKIDVPSHTPLMEQVRAEFAHVVERVSFRQPTAMYCANVDGRRLVSGIEIARDLIDSLTVPVRWFDATQTLFESGTRCFVETFLGDALTNLCREAFPESIAMSLAQMSLPSVVARCTPFC